MTQNMKMPLRAQGGKIVDASGNEVLLTGVNWFGLETETFAPHGLDKRSWSDMLDQMVRLGFNALRLPFSNELFKPGSTPNGINANPDLVGRTGPQIMDKIVEGATSRGMMVILDRHRPTRDKQSALWYTDQVTEETWIGDWTNLATRYANNPLVIGADLHNEPHDPASWGDGNQATDWRLAAERAGNAVLAANPNWLIFVEGIESYHQPVPPEVLPPDVKAFNWWGSNLAGARKDPVRLTNPSKLVYSAHDYGKGVFNQPWFQDGIFPTNLPCRWEFMWAYLVEEQKAPVLIGEFGGKSVDANTNEGIWQRSLVKYLKDNHISYTYWTWTPDSGDTGGVLADDFTTVNKDKMDLLSTYLAPRRVPVPA